MANKCEVLKMERDTSSCYGVLQRISAVTRCANQAHTEALLCTSPVAQSNAHFKTALNVPSGSR